MLPEIKYSILISALFFSAVSLSGQSTFDQRVDDLFFQLPRNTNIQEVGFLLSADTTFSNVRSSRGCKPGPCIIAAFVFNPILPFLRDTGHITFSFYDSVRVFTFRTINIWYEESYEVDFDQQFSSLYRYFNDVSYSSEEQPDHDEFPGEQILFFGDKGAYSTRYPRISLHSNFHKGRNGKPGIYSLMISFTEEH